MRKTLNQEHFLKKEITCETENLLCSEVLRSFQVKVVSEVSFPEESLKLGQEGGQKQNRGE